MVENPADVLRDAAIARREIRSFRERNSLGKQIDEMPRRLPRGIVRHGSVHDRSKLADGCSDVLLFIGRQPLLLVMRPRGAVLSSKGSAAGRLAVSQSFSRR